MRKSVIREKGGLRFAAINDLIVPEWYEPKALVQKSKFLKKSLEKKGFLRPLVINTYLNREGIILDGVELYTTCLESGIAEVPVYTVSIPHDQESSCHVLLNKFQGEHDKEQMVKLLHEQYKLFFEQDDEVINRKSTVYDSDSRLLEQSASDGYYNNAMAKATAAYATSPKNTIDLIRRVNFNLAPPYRDYPEMAKKIMGCESLSALFTELLKYCVEEELNDVA